MEVSVCVEGMSDEGAASAIIKSCGLSVGKYYGRGGKNHLLKKLSGYNAAAVYAPWVAFVDLDNDGPCPGQKRLDWLPDPAEFMRFRVVVREMEAWLLADAERISEFLGVSRMRIPSNPEDLDDPKEALIALARRSRKSAIRRGLVPRGGSGASVGPTYASDIREFGRSQWRPLVAAEVVPSLNRCISRIRDLAEVLATDSS